MSEKSVVILGLGMQGKAALYDIVQNSDVASIIVADNNPELDTYLKDYPSNRVRGKILDATDPIQLKSLIRDAFIIIDSLPGHFAFPIASMAANLGVNLVSSMYYLNPSEKDPKRIQQLQEELHNLDLKARKQGIIILPEFGLDPGIDLVLGAKALSELDSVEEFYSYGTGVPAIECANNPLKYKFSWSVSGVLHAYCRPSKIISKRQTVEIDSMEIFSPENRHMLEIEELNIPLECYPNGNSVYYADLFGIKDSVKEMGRYACRWPGHCDFWHTMIKSGFLSEEPIRVGKVNTSPLEFTASLLGSQKQFRYNEKDLDIVMVRVDLRGRTNSKRKRTIYQLIDKRDLDTGFTAMQRTVGFTMGLGARLILDGRLNNMGLISPIEVPFDILEEGLKQHGMEITRQEIPINE